MSPSETVSSQNTEVVRLQIQRIYVKDISFESPEAPQVFQTENWEPALDLKLTTETQTISEGLYEVSLRITVTAKQGERVLFIGEVQQAGLFEIKGLENEQLQHCLGAFCPGILFPYARECLSSLVSRGTFPQLNLAPINFDLLFAEQKKAQAERADQSTKSSESSHA